MTLPRTLTPCSLLSLSLILAILSITGATAAHTLNDEHEPLRVGIIGAGVSGAYVAYAIRHWLNDTHPTVPVIIDVLERHSTSGGRVQSLTLDGWRFEAGASIIHASNQYLYNLSIELNLTRTRPPSESKHFGVYDFHQRSFAYVSSEWRLMTVLRLVWRYGLWSLLRLNAATKEAANRFYSLYNVQRHNQSFSTVDALAERAELLSLTQMSLREHLESQIVGAKLTNELVMGVEHVNYNQDPTTISALAGYVGLIPTVDSDLFAIRGGNRQLIDGTLGRAMARVRLDHSAENVSSEMNNGHRLYTVSGTNAHTGRRFHYNYDWLVMATPLELSNISIALNETLPLREFQSTVATFVSGTLNYSYFGRRRADMPSMVLTAGCHTHSADTDTGNDSDNESRQCPFSSLAAHHYNASTGRTQYKLFSVRPLSQPLLQSLFANITDAVSVPWLAYPKYRAPEQFAPFVLTMGDGGSVYYVNAFENAVSCMEAMAVAAVNVAKLVQQAIDDRLKVWDHRTRIKHPKSYEIERQLHDEL